MSDLRPVAALEGVTAYRPAAAADGIDLRLDGTERRSLPANVVERLATVTASDLSRYPDADGLEARIAECNGVGADRVLVTAGADEALDRVCRALLGPERHCVLATPTFEMLPRYARLVGAKIDEVDWPGGALPTEALCAAARPETAVIAIVSPNNPTGAVASASAVRTLAETVPHALVVVDQAYGEFADVDLTPVVTESSNALTVRTLSKAYGLSGLRVGYAIGPAEVVAWMRAAGGPYAVARPSLRLADARYADAGDVDAYVARVRTERAVLESLLAGLGAYPMPSQANFVLCRFDDAAALDVGLAHAGIAVRAFPGRPGLEHHRRISCPGDDVEFERLTAALRAVLGGMP